MFRVIPRAIRDVGSLDWHRVEARCCFTTSTAWGATRPIDPVERQQENAAKRERYRTDPEYRARIRFLCNKSRRAFTARLSEEQLKLVYLMESFRKLVTRRLAQGERLVWNTHVVEFTHDAKTHCCGSCGRASLRGSRLWWRRIQDGAYECFPCFTKDISSAMPLGYQDWLSSHIARYGLTENNVLSGSSTKPDLDHQLPVNPALSKYRVK